MYITRNLLCITYLATATLVAATALAACDDSGPSTASIDAAAPDADAAEPDAAPAGPAWTQAFDASETGWLLNVWGPAPDNLYAVGGSLEEGLIMHYDGSAWSELDLGADVDVPLLNWTYGFGPDDITVVGATGTVLHWDGATWEQQPTPTDQNLWGVWGASSDDMWAVGGAGREAGQATILHYDGETWTKEDVPALQRANVYAFFKVWGTGADNVYIVGQRGVVLHYDGETWTEEFAGVSGDLISLWGSGPDHIVAVGGRNVALASVWDGTEWTPIDLGALPGLNGVWVAADGTSYVVGVTGVALMINSDAASYASQYVSLPLLAGQVDFHAIYSADGKTLVSVGGNLSVTNPPFQGVAYEATIATEE
ncbi:MAG: hypothetical protein Tsb0020_14500 [Haliangiales bacterium]